MRICFVSDSYPLVRPFGGIGIYTQTAARALSRLGHEVHVLVPWPHDSQDLTDGAVRVHFRRVRWLPGIAPFFPKLGESFGLARALRSLHRETPFDLVEFPNFEGLGLIAQLWGFVPSVVRLHTSTADSLEAQKRRPGLGERYLMWAEQRSARLARGLVTHSASHRSRTAALSPAHSIELIPHGIELPERPPGIAAKLSVLTIGRLSARKGGKTFLQAAAQVLAADQDIHFDIVGADENDPMAREFRRQHAQAAPSQISFRGFLSTEELERLWQETAIYASASNYESFGLTFVEAMAHAIPVIGCDISAMQEIIRPGQNGLLVAPGDPESLASAIIQLARDAQLRRRLGEAGRRRVEEHYTAERMGMAIERWYGSLLTR